MTTPYERAPVATSTDVRQTGSVRANGRTRRAGGGVVSLLALGGLHAYFGGRIFQGRAPGFVDIALWVLAAFDVLVVIGLFASQNQINTNGGIISVEPAIGFCLAVGGLVVSVVGTVLVQPILRTTALDTQLAQKGR